MLKEKETIKLFNSWLELTEFGLKKDKDGFWLYDYQGADLGNISEDRFTTIGEVMDRMTIYEEDYIITDLCEHIDELLGTHCYYNYWEDLLQYREKCVERFGNGINFLFDLLDLTCNECNISLEKCFYEEGE